MEGTLLGVAGDEVSIMPVVYPCETVSVSSLGSLSSVGSSYKPSSPSLFIYLRARHIQEYFKNKRGRKQKTINTHQDKARGAERR